MPQLDPSTFGTQLFWLGICFVALYGVMALIVLPRISSTLQARAAQLDDDLAEAEALREKAEMALAAYEEALAEARSRALTLAQDMRAEVQAETDRQKAALDAKLAEQAQAAEVAMTKARDAAMDGLSDAASALVGDVRLADAHTERRHRVHLHRHHACGGEAAAGHGLLALAFCGGGGGELADERHDRQGGGQSARLRRVHGRRRLHQR